MFAPGSYEPLWLAVGVFLLALGCFVAVSRRALDRSSRKLLLERVGPARYEELERFLGEKEAHERSLEKLDIALRTLFAFSLAVGRFIWLDRFLSAPEGPAGGGQGLASLSIGALSLAAGILLLEVVAANLLFLEVVPALIGRTRPEEWLVRFRGAIQRLRVLTRPVAWLVDTAAGIFVPLFGGDEERSAADIVEEEILSKVEEGEREGIFESKEIDMIESIISFRDVEVSDVMTPRTGMVCLDLAAPLEENLDKAIECGHSRIPVYREHKDNIVGILYVKDLLRSLYRKEEIVLESLLRRPYCVSTTKKINELLQEFRQHRLHIAIVLDEYGGTDGLVTIEDILEEIVGEISDEYEKDEVVPIERVSDRVVDVDASVHIDDLNEELELGIPESESYDTIGGFLFANMGRIPAVGDVFEIDGIRFEVTSADERRVHRLHVHLPERNGALKEE